LVALIHLRFARACFCAAAQGHLAS
jgi:hypothetical protein